MTSEDVRTPPGLEGVVVAETQLGGVRGEEGFFHYRRYAATELAASYGLEDIWYLLHRGDLPTVAEAAAFRRRVGRLRDLPEPVLDLVARIAATGRDVRALAWLRTAVSLCAQHLELAPWLGRDRERLAAEAIRLAAVVPTLVAAGWRARQGHPPVPPDPERSVAADLLHMLHGTDPSPLAVAALDRYLTLTVDHGLNASTFAARTVVSTGADLGSGLVAALAALSGPLHGGAPLHALRMLREIGTPERAEAWLRDALTRGERIMGFGHRVYRTEDPRSVALRRVALGFDDPLVELAAEVERTALRLLAEHRPGRRLRTNVEYYAGVVLHLCGIPDPLLPACFAVSRSIGWTAHVLEQTAHNRLVRPKAAYVGPPAPQPVPAPGR